MKQPGVLEKKNLSKIKRKNPSKHQPVCSYKKTTWKPDIDRGRIDKNYLYR